MQLRVIIRAINRIEVHTWLVSDVVSVSWIDQNWRKYKADLVVLQVRIVRINALNANSELKFLFWKFRCRLSSTRQSTPSMCYTVLRGLSFLSWRKISVTYDDDIVLCESIWFSWYRYLTLWSILKWWQWSKVHIGFDGGNPRQRIR